MVKVAIGAGHGFYTKGKRSPNDEREWFFNKQVVEYAIKHLRDYDGIDVLRVDDRTGKTDVPLQERTDNANSWGADIYISCHHNANTGEWGTWTGTETYTYEGNWNEAEKLAGIVHGKVIGAYGLANRGLKKANFHVLRETKMPAILIEGGFMDSEIDIKKLRDDSVLEKVGQAIAEGVAEYFGLKKREKSTSDIHRLIVDGKQVIALKDDDNLLNEVKSYLGKAKEIKIQKV
ncbi:N-acetylmuramoyl-L-alanine amidase [Terrihalobacillus insolitus]|uniref:N-acetylmuramoyl-L-alanine amidase n=1 Tax=Terrihalobacillus insolitus TaxID=2950438 RepID=UPI002342787A|nr:N-acetylmuramoyl-L-alanine amidase [Terrihalobacillus insolitus]MDC3414257.1 N-acetylmuramoyl-L-alanine amidase [Terrihalobacillus insolitus]